jgi:hypothetical protein
MIGYQKAIIDGHPVWLTDEEVEAIRRAPSDAAYQAAIEAALDRVRAA